MNKKPGESPVSSNGQPRRQADGAPGGEQAARISNEWIAPALHRLYDNVLDEPIPDGFVDLLKQLHNLQKK